jgi:hypothetical protein
VTRAKKSGDISISYRRIRDCLDQFETPTNNLGARFYRLSAMINKIYKYLNSREVFSEMPYEKTDDFKAPSDFGKWLAEDREGDDDLEEQDAVARRLPTFGRSKLVDFHQEVSATGRQRREHQWMQLGLSCIRCAFSNCLTKKEAANDNYLWKLVTIIFRSCQLARKYAYTLQDIFMVCRDQETVREKKKELRLLFDDPASFFNTPVGR